MSEQIANVKVEDKEYISISAATGISVGTGMYIQNRGFKTLTMIESATQPEFADDRGVTLTALSGDYAAVSVGAGSLDIWVKCNDGRTKIHVEGV